MSFTQQAGYGQLVDHYCLLIDPSSDRHEMVCGAALLIILTREQAASFGSYLPYMHFSTDWEGRNLQYCTYYTIMIEEDEQ